LIESKSSSDQTGFHVEKTMPKEFYTERDIEDLFKRGTTSLEVDEDIVLTELAFEKAQRLGLKLISRNSKPPSAPERPYLSKLPSPAAQLPANSAAISTPSPVQTDIRQKIKDAVNAKLGNQVDPILLDSIITRVLDALNKR
jgi:hypothetical protein